MTGRISEVFDSIQGEGLYLGEKQIFVRFFGCNLNCHFCDTKLNRFSEYAPEELLEEIKLYNKDNYHSISFTGGEPLLHIDFLKEVLPVTSYEGHKNYLETNGTLPGELQEVIDYVDIVAMDIKLPSSSRMGHLWGLHKRFLKIASQKEVFIKIVVCQSSHEDDLKQAIKLIHEVKSCPVVVLQPNSYERQQHLQEKLKDFKSICRRAGVTACVIRQMHKIIGYR